MTNNRKFQWLFIGVSLLAVIAACVYLYTQGGSRGPGVPPGQQLRRFAAPLAKSNANGVANLHPVCDGKPLRGLGLQVCGQRATVVGFFATGLKSCISSVNAMQSIAHEFRGVKFAVVAVGGTRSATAALMEQNHWRIKVAYDPTGAIGQLYDVQVCPLIEVVRPGGVVAGRLTGDGWTDPARLAARLRTLLNVA